MKIVKVVFRLRFLEMVDGVYREPETRLPLDTLNLFLNEFSLKTTKREDVLFNISGEPAVTRSLCGGMIEASFNINGDFEDKEYVVGVRNLIMNNKTEADVFLSDICDIKLITEGDNNDIQLYPVNFGGTVYNDNKIYVYMTDLNTVLSAELICEYHYKVATLDPKEDTVKFCESVCISSNGKCYNIDTCEKYRLCGMLGVEYGEERFFATSGYRDSDNPVTFTTVTDESVELIDEINKNGFNINPDETKVFIGTNADSKLHADNVIIDRIMIELAYGGKIMKTINIPYKNEEV